MTDDLNNAKPVVAIGGVGGSGTRVFAECLAGLGWTIGSDLNDALDNLAFTLLFKRREAIDAPAASIRLLMELFRARMGGTFDADLAAQVGLAAFADEDRPSHPQSWLAERLERFCARGPAPTGPWGWKEPNTHIFAERFLETWPAFRYIHVMRHGLDMALSRNQQQLALWGPAFLGRAVDIGPRDSLAYWCAAHRRIDAVLAAFPDRTLLLTYEAMCARPRETAARIAGFCGVTPDPAFLDRFAAGVSPSRGVGRGVSESRAAFADSDVAYVKSKGYAVD